MKNITNIVVDIRETTAKNNKTASWYEKNSVETIYNAVAHSNPADRDDIEEKIVVEPADLNKTQDDAIIAEAESLLAERPGKEALAFAWVFGKAANKKQEFVQSLQEKGGNLIEEVQAKLDNSRQQLAEAQNRGWKGLEQPQEFYKEFRIAAADKDKGAIISALNSNAAQNVAPAVKRMLLLKPVAEKQNALEVIAELPFETVQEESVFVAKTLESFADDAEALYFMRSATATMADGPTKTKYEKYATAFAGQLVPIDKKYDR